MRCKEMNAMPPKQQHVTDAELKVLKLLWERGRLTARSIRETLYPRGGESELATVQKLLQRLERKGMVLRDRSSFAHEFEAGVTQADVVGHEIESLAQKLTDGSMVPLLMHAVRNADLTPEQRRELRALLNKR